MSRASAFRSLSFCLALSAGCNAERLSVGELRCVGDLSCEHEVTALDPSIVQGFGALPQLPDAEPELSWAWFTKLDCSDAGLFNLRGRLLVHDDGTVTALHFGLGRVDGTGGGPRIARFDASGQALGASRDELDGLERERQRQMLAAVARDAADTAYLAASAPADDSGRVTLHVYRIEDDGELSFQFEDRDGRHVQGLAVDDHGFLVSGFIESHATGPIEVARYSPEGELVYRQSGLRRRFSPLASSFDENWSATLSVAGPGHGRAFALTQGFDNGRIGLALLDARGEVHAHLETWLQAQTLLATDSHGWPVLAGAVDEADSGEFLGVGGLDGYMLLKLDPEQPNGQRSRATFRMRQDYYPAVPAALALDHEDNIYVATTLGSATMPELVIERFASDLASRQVLHFPLPDLDETPNVVLADSIASIALRPDGGIYALALVLSQGVEGDGMLRSCMGLGLLR